jgi:hypothetical protein
MKPKQHNSESIEQLLAEAAELERAGVFNRTPVKVDSLMAASNRRGGWFSHRVKVALQMAACLALVMGGAWLWQMAGRTGTQQVASNGLHQPVPVVNMISLTRCITGPADLALSSECATVDFDADGDVDLADFGRIQLASGAR